MVDPNSVEVMIGEGPALLSRTGHVAHLELNRPDSANGLNIEMLEAVQRALRVCSGETGIRAVLLTGRGANFCAGGDVHTFLSKGERLSGYIRQATALLQEVIAALIHLDAPIVTAAHGYTAGGGGMGLLCASDMVVVGQSAKFLVGATRVGMAPDAGLSVTLPRLVGPRKAAELLFLNSSIDSQEALQLGLINRVVADAELVEAAKGIADKIAEGAPLALQAAKRLLWTGVGLGVDAAMPEESRTVADLCRTADVQEGLSAVVGKRPAKFTGR